MRTVQMTLDAELVKHVDQVSKRLKTTRSGFTRQALREALTRYDVQQQEERHREGYRRRPVQADECAEWETEQAWGAE